MVWGKRSHLVFQTDRNSGEVIRWLGNFSIWPFQTLALSGKDWSDQETFDLNSTSHYRIPGNIFAVLFKYGFRFPAQVSWSLAKGCILSYRPTSWTIPWPPITNPVTRNNAPQGWPQNQRHPGHHDCFLFTTQTIVKIFFGPKLYI